MVPQEDSSAPCSFVGEDDSMTNIQSSASDASLIPEGPINLGFTSFSSPSLIIEVNKAWAWGDCVLGGEHRHKVLNYIGEYSLLNVFFSNTSNGKELISHKHF